jgi:hypothetical protein
LIVGYSNGLIRIRDSETFKNIVFECTLADGNVEDVMFHLDEYANLRVIHKSGATTNLILKRDPQNYQDPAS